MLFSFDISLCSGIYTILYVTQNDSSMTYLTTLGHYLALNFLQSSLFDFGLCVHFPLSGILVDLWSELIFQGGIDFQLGKAIFPMVVHFLSFKIDLKTVLYRINRKSCLTAVVHNFHVFS